MSPSDDSGMTLKDAITQFIAANDPAEPQLVLLERALNAPPSKDRQRPQMVAFDRKRRSLMHLRPRHLVWVEELGIREHYNRSDMHDFMLENYNTLFGPLRRPKSKEVPSDRFRKSWMIGNLLDLVEARRAEIEQEAAYRDSK
jgi:hypothetical protein